MKRKYRLIRGTEILLWTVAVGLIAFYLCRLGGVNPNFATAIALALISASVFVGTRNTRVFSVNEKDLARYLNRHYP
ncbi:MAG TPA: hypothetical protein VFD46_14330, partial [Chryseolinea sp.]|nr:hypothetical protein [Chryseolinea sp.]